MSENPLKAYFRRPEIYVTLPGRGSYWPDGSIDIPINGELAVYPMTAADEIALRTPDALMNGDATITLLQSCVPAIKNAWDCPVCDLESLLIASRIASNGNTLDLSVNCPNCEHENEFTVDLRQQLDLLTAGPWNEAVDINGLEFHFKPITFRQNNDFNNRFFAVQRTLQQLDQLEDRDERDRISKDMVTEVSAINQDILIASIAAINVDDQHVTESEYIREFLQNCDRKMNDKISGKFEELRRTCRPKNLDIQCESCSFDFTVPFAMDYGSFFAQGSWTTTLARKFKSF